MNCEKYKENFIISIGSFRNHPEQFLEYLRMCVETSHILKSKVSHWLQKQTKNYRQTILHAERVAVKIKIDFMKFSIL